MDSSFSFPPDGEQAAHRVEADHLRLRVREPEDGVSRSQRGMAAQVDLTSRGKPAQPPVLPLPDGESRLRQVIFPGDGLHLLLESPAFRQTHRRRVSLENTLGKGIHHILYQWDLPSSQKKPLDQARSRNGPEFQGRKSPLPRYHPDSPLAQGALSHPVTGMGRTARRGPLGSGVNGRRTGACTNSPSLKTGPRSWLRLRIVFLSLSQFFLLSIAFPVFEAKSLDRSVFSLRSKNFSLCGFIILYTEEAALLTPPHRHGDRFR